MLLLAETTVVMWLKIKLRKGCRMKKGWRLVSLGTEHRRGPTQYDCAIGGRHLGDLAVTERGVCWEGCLPRWRELSGW